MKRTLAILAVVPLLAAPARTEDKPVKAAQSCILVELFSSQGCSSCPPAEEFLARIAKREKGFENIVAIAWHVDYWDQLGWKDPFASKENSQLQARYARNFALRAQYTPMFLVNGASHTSQPPEVEKALASESKIELPAKITIRGTRAAGKASLEVDFALNANEPGTFEIVLVAVEDNLMTDIKAGELKDRSVVEFAVARWSATRNYDGKLQTYEISLSDDWKRDNLSFVAFVRSGFSMRTMGAARIPFGDLEESDGK